MGVVEAAGDDGRLLEINRRDAEAPRAKSKNRFSRAGVSVVVRRFEIRVIRVNPRREVFRKDVVNCARGHRRSARADVRQVAAARRVWRVADLVSAARTALEREYTDVWVEGEISNFRSADSGHLYFTLKDGDSAIADRDVPLLGAAAALQARRRPAVIARGRVTIYEARGELQLSAEYLEPKGAGALQLAFEQLKAKLAAEGLFDAARKKPLPALPRRIGIVTSPRGAAIQDMLNILRRRHASVPILIYPAQVQGEAAPGEVRAGIQLLQPRTQRWTSSSWRGAAGRSKTWRRSTTKRLARAIAASAVPVISAWDMRPTSPSPTLSPTCARPRPPLLPNW